MAKATEAQKLAEDFGYQLAFLKSDPELYKIFQTAMAKNWDATRFVSAVKGSNWFKTHGESYRTNMSLKTTDPATWKQNLSGQTASVGDLARQLGATLSSAQLSKISGDALMFGWNDNQIRNVLAQHIRTTGKSVGMAGDVRAALQQTAYRNGIALSEAYVTRWAQTVAKGDATLEDAKRQMRSQYAESIAPGFAKAIRGGQDLYDLASPYMQTMAQTLELNPSDVDLFDPTVRKALATAGTKDGKPGSTPLWQFEQQLRQDPRYMKTKQAQDSTMSVGHQVLKDMGLMGQ